MDGTLIAFVLDFIKFSLIGFAIGLVIAVHIGLNWIPCWIPWFC